jgi:protein-tyrosine phosphatase
MSLTHPFFPLLIEKNSSRLFFTPCPGTKEVGLQESLEQLVAAGAAAIVTLMPKDEMQRNAVVDLPELCRQLDLEWFHLPIEDDHAPEEEFTDAWAIARNKIHKLLDDGKSIAIHCKGGTGRTGLVIALILVERGVSAEEARAQVQSVRPNALQIPAQLEFLQNFGRQFLLAHDSSEK